MKKLFLLTLLFSPLVVFGDTPPPGTVKAKMYTGDGNTALTATGSSLNSNLTNSSIAVTGSFWQATQPVSGTFWQATQPVSLLSLPSLAAGSNLIGSVNVNGTVPVSGTFWQATQPVSLLNLPALATGANTIGAVNINGTVPISGTITATNSANGNTGSSAPAQATQVGGSDGTNLRALKVSSAGVLSIDGSATTQPVSGTFWQATQPVSGTFWQATQPVSGTVAATQSGTWNLTNISGTVSLPTGAATAANQTTGNSSLSSIDTKTPSLGQALAAASVPVVLPAAQISTLTPLSSVTVTQGTGTNLHTVVDSSALPSGASTSAKQPALGTAGSASSDVITVQGVTSMTPLKTDGSGTTQPVSGTVTANAGTGTFTVDGSGHTQPVSGTFWQATQPVSGTFWQATQPVSLSTLPALTAGTAIVGKVGIDQTTPGTTNGVQVNAALPAGSNVIGHVIVDTAPSTAVTNAGTFATQATPVVPAAVTVKQAAITIGTSAVRLTTDGLSPSSTRVLLAVQLLSTSTANCYFGSSGVTSSSTTRGVQFLAGQTLSFNRDAGDYYGICDTTSQTVLITEQE